MKTLVLLVVLPLAAMVNSLAQLAFTYNSGFANGGMIMDGNINSWSDTRAVSGTAGRAITAVSVRLSLSGGYNGDLFAYLSHNGVLVPLLNRVGVGSGEAFGYGDAGLNVRFSDAAAHNIHFYQTVVGYSIMGEAAWQPDGRAINPLTSSPSSFNLPGSRLLNAFLGMSPDGDWTLALSDVSAGGGQTTVLSWGLDITSVPEPAALAAAWGAGLLLVPVWRARRAAWSRHGDASKPVNA